MEKFVKALYDTPDTPEWNDISDNWPNVIHTYLKSEDDLSEKIVQETINLINYCI